MRAAALVALGLVACATAPATTASGPVHGASGPAGEGGPPDGVEAEPFHGPVGASELPFHKVATDVRVTGGTGDVVALRFGWPAGATALVSSETATRYEYAGVPPAPKRIRTDCSLEADPPDDGLGWQVIRAGGCSVETEGYVEEARDMIATVTSGLPGDGGWIVDRRGALAVPPRGEAREVAIPGGDVALGTTGHGLVETALSPEAAGVRAREAWDELVGRWAGTRLELGATYRFRFRAPLPGGLVVVRTAELSAVGRVACAIAEEADAPRCVRIELRTRPDAASTWALLAPVLPLLQTLGLPDGSLAKLAIEEETVLITEPDGLFPHRLEARRRTGIGGPERIPDGSLRGWVAERHVVFDWTAR